MDGGFIPFAGGRLAGAVLPRGAALARLALDGAPVILGLPSAADYARPALWMGAVCGRVANRLGEARAAVDGRVWRLAANDGPHMLHGGPGGLSQRDWAVVAAGGDAVALAVESPDGDQGFPGALRVWAEWRILPPATLRLVLTAAADAPTPVNLCQHLYLNLDGGATVDGHRLTTAAARFLRTDAALIPTGAVAAVEGTPLDYRAPRPPGRHDATLILGRDPRAAPAFAARLESGGRAVEVWTTEPALHLYTGDHLPAGLPLAGGGATGPRGGLCLEAMRWTDAPNHAGFPGITLRPGQPWRQVTEFRFA